VKEEGESLLAVEGEPSLLRPVTMFLRGSRFCSAIRRCVTFDPSIENEKEDREDKAPNQLRFGPGWSRPSIFES
jgi:hypothetical protein